MSPVLVDSNVLLDVASEDPEWFDWSADTLSALLDESVVVINPIIYGEIAVGFDRIEDVERVVPLSLYRREQLSYGAVFLAAQCHRDYRRRGGTRRTPLPDFLIGAHAAFTGYRLLTRDAARYRTYFPTVELITP